MRHHLPSLAVVSLLSTGACAFAQPANQTPPAPKHPPAAQAEAATTTVTGRLTQWLINPNGDVDGFLLANAQGETQVAFPPHLSAALMQAFKPGDAVQVNGRRAANLSVLRADSVTSTSSGRSVVNTPREPGERKARGPRESGALTAMSASGRVTRVLYTGRGDANGVLLDGGSIVRFAPHQSAKLLAELQVGKTVHARGWGSRNDKGNALEATAIGPTADGMQELFDKPGKRHQHHGGPKDGPHGAPIP